MFRYIFILFLLCIVSFAINAQDANPLKGNKIKKENAAAKNITRADFNFEAKTVRQLQAVEAQASKKSKGASSFGQFFASGKRLSFDSNNLAKTTFGSDVSIRFNERNSTPSFITGKKINGSLKKSMPGANAGIIALNFMQENKELFKLEDPSSELKVSEEFMDKFGKKHARFSQSYNNIPVWGGDIAVHMDGDGSIYAINARYIPSPKTISLRKSSGISNSEAIEIAKKDLSGSVKITELSDWAKNALSYNAPVAAQYIWTHDDTQETYLVWHVHVRPNIEDSWYYFINAETGDILEKYNATAHDGPQTAQATDLNNKNKTIHVYQVGSDYFMLDASRSIWQAEQPDIINNPKGGLLTLDLRNNDLAEGAPLYLVVSKDGSWNDPASVSAHANVGEVFEYFENVHGRKAIDGKGSTVLSIIHATKNGGGMDNASWNGIFMIYGDGNIAFKPLAGGLDVAAHEMAHGVTQHTVGLEYKNQSGALNESLSDIFGAMVDNDDWLMGDDITKTDYISTGALRNLQDPHNGGSAYGDRGWQPAHMNEFVDLPIDKDNGGVHVNSGINNRACFLMAEQIGREKTEKIYYRLMDARYLNTQSNFVDMRLAAIQAATDLYGDNSAEVNAVKAAYDGVGITGSDGSQQDPDLPPVNGKQWVAAIDKDSETLYLMKPELTGGNDDFIQLTTTKVYTNTSNPITVTENGSTIIFVDAANNIRIISSDGSKEEPLTSNGVWASVSLSPDGTKLAATTTFADSSIYIIELTEQGNLYKYKLYTPTTQEGVKEFNVLYADAIDWNLTSDYLIFDNYSEIAKTGDEKLSFWSVNALKIDDGLILNIFPPQAEGISMGNPSFGQTNDTYFLFDYIDNNLGISNVMSANLFSGKINLVEENGASIGFPKYSSDDRTVVFQRYDSFLDKPTIRKIAMDETKTAPAGSSVDYVIDGLLPTWFTIGSRPVANEPEDHTPYAFSLDQNFPNPFNPSTRISFNIAQAGHVSLKVYDILGKEAASLVDEYMSAGNYNIDFNAGLHGSLASGVYIYRLNVQGQSISKKMMFIK